MVLCRIITTPTELIKIKQQLPLATGAAASSARAIALQIYRLYGIAGFYRGFAATALRDCGYGAYFAAVRTFFFPTPSLLVPSTDLF
jgi:solute carrier family 25 carnitine/acylcarnitine transporter 20/29